MKVEMAVLGSPSLTVLMVSVDVKRHERSIFVVLPPFVWFPRKQNMRSPAVLRSRRLPELS